MSRDKEWKVDFANNKLGDKLYYADVDVSRGDPICMTDNDGWKWYRPGIMKIDRTLKEFEIVGFARPTYEGHWGDKSQYAPKLIAWVKPLRVIYGAPLDDDDMDGYAMWPNSIQVFGTLDEALEWINTKEKRNEENFKESVPTFQG